MSKTWEHYQDAARHHERAAHQLKEAAKYHQTEEHEKAMHHAYLAHGHAQQALLHDFAAAVIHVESCDGDATRASEKKTRARRADERASKAREWQKL